MILNWLEKFGREGKVVETTGNLLIVTGSSQLHHTSVGGTSLRWRTKLGVMALDVMIHPRLAPIHGTKPGVGNGAFTVPELAVAGIRRIKS